MNDSKGKICKTVLPCCARNSYSRQALPQKEIYAPTAVLANKQETHTFKGHLDKANKPGNVLHSDAFRSPNPTLVLDTLSDTSMSGRGLLL
jgi:hypothetical protein